MRRLACLCLVAVLAPASASGAANEHRSALASDAPRSASAAAAGPQAPRRQEEFDVALAALDGGRWAEAARGFEALIGGGDWPEASYNAALARYQMLELGPALHHARAASAGLPQDARAAWLHAVIEAAIGRHDDARAHATLAVTLAGAEEAGLRVRAWLLVSEACAQLGRLADAEAAVAHAIAGAAEAGDAVLITAAALAERALLLGRGDLTGAAAALARAGGAGKAAGIGRHELGLSEAEAAWRAGAGGDARALLAASLAALDADDALDPLRRAGLLSRAAPLLYAAGSFEEAARWLEAAESVLEPAGAEAGVADVAVVRAGWAVARGDAVAAAALLDRAIGIQERLQVPLALAGARLSRAQLTAELGDVRGALRAAEEARAVYSELGALEGQAAAWLVVAELQGRGGALAEAHRSALAALDLAIAAGAPRAAAAARAETAVVLARMEALREATMHYEAATVTAGAGGSLLSARSRVRLEVEMARAFARASRTEQALVHAQRAVAGAGPRSAAPVDLVPLAEESVVAVLLDAGRQDEAEAFLTERGIDTPRLVAAVRDRQGTALYNAGVDAYDAGDFAGALAAFDALSTRVESSEERRGSALRALQRTLVARGTDPAHARTAAADLERAGAIAADRGDAVGLAEVHLLRARSALVAERHDEAAALADRVLGSDAASDSLRADASEIVGMARMETDPTAARAAFVRALSLIEADDEAVARRATLTYNLAVLEQLGDPEALRARLRDAEALAIGAADAALQADIRSWLSELEVPDE